jgi:hypothetical protein
MSAFAFVTAAALAAAPCVRVVVAPFEPVATSAAEARRAEQLVREGLARRPGVCVEPRASTIAHLGSFARRRLPPCGDEACRRAQREALGADELVQGVVVGAGGYQHVELERARAAASERATVLLRGEGDVEAVHAALASWSSLAPRPPTPRWPALVTSLAAAAAAGAAVGFGLEARRLEAQLSAGTTGCPAGAPAFRDCVDAQLATGRRDATAATALSVAAGVLAGGAVVLWVVELP